MTELLFIRHGETDWNRQQRFQGHVDIPLNDTGRAQAMRLAARLAAERHDLLFSSDLQRARQTAAPLAAAWGRDDGVLPGFREQNFGLLEGLDAPTIQAEHPALWRGWLQQDADFAAPGGESQRQFHTRVLGAVRERSPGPAATDGSLHQTRCCAGTDDASPNTGPNHPRELVDRQPTPRSG